LQVTPKVDHVTDALHRLAVLSTAAGDAYRRDNEPGALFQCHYVNVFAEHDLTVQHAHDDDDSHIQELLSRYQNNEKVREIMKGARKRDRDSLLFFKN